MRAGPPGRLHVRDMQAGAPQRPALGRHGAGGPLLGAHQWGVRPRRSLGRGPPAPPRQARLRARRAAARRQPPPPQGVGPPDLHLLTHYFEYADSAPPRLVKFSQHPMSLHALHGRHLEPQLVGAIPLQVSPIRILV